MMDSAPNDQIPEHLDDVGRGWHPLLMECHEQLVVLAPDYRVGQLKEKFGGLRLYLDGSYAPEVYPLVHATEEKSHQICEWCGAQGVLRTDRRWVLTLCDTCHERRKNEDPWA